MCLNELGINGYIIPDLSNFRCEALDKGIANVAIVSELAARDMCICIICHFNIVHILFVA
jgi:hypothetical protein